MDNEEKKNEETLLQTIRARLEWNEKRSVDFIPDTNGKWNIVETPNRSNSGLITYFKPNYDIGLDKYGQLPSPNNKEE